MNSKWRVSLQRLLPQKLPSGLLLRAVFRQFETRFRVAMGFPQMILLDLQMWCGLTPGSCRRFCVCVKWTQKSSVGKSSCSWAGRRYGLAIFLCTVIPNVSRSPKSSLLQRHWSISCAGSHQQTTHQCIAWDGLRTSRRCLSRFRVRLELFLDWNDGYVNHKHTHCPPNILSFQIHSNPFQRWDEHYGLWMCKNHASLLGLQSLWLDKPEFGSLWPSWSVDRSLGSNNHKKHRPFSFVLRILWLIHSCWTRSCSF